MQSLFDSEATARDRLIWAVIDFSAMAHDGLKVHAELLRHQARQLDDLENRIQLELRRVVQAITDLGSEDQEPESDQLGPDDHGESS